MDFAIDNAMTMIGAAVPLVTDHFHHNKGVEHTAELHKEAIVQAAEHHKTEIDQSKTLHKREIAESRRLHELEKSHAEELHQMEMRLARELFEKEREIARTQHMQQLAQALRHHSHQIKVAYEAARRENLRDVWIQKSRKADTLLITATLMFASIIAILCEGNPPTLNDSDTVQDEWIMIAWAFAMASSMVPYRCITEESPILHSVSVGSVFLKDLLGLSRRRATLKHLAP
eukprot:m.618826 g.618826  ORF g.618826 m.618826 type:complete len:231 (+) comp22529_c2_seq16:448-1140(+)